jgi:hypothetical protein
MRADGSERSVGVRGCVPFPAFNFGGAMISDLVQWRAAGGMRVSLRLRESVIGALIPETLLDLRWIEIGFDSGCKVLWGNPNTGDLYR